MGKINWITKYWYDIKNIDLYEDEIKYDELGKEIKNINDKNI